MSEQPPQNPYYPSPPQGFPFSPPDHPRAVLILVLGIIGVSFAQVCAPVAWYLGSQAKAEIEASNGAVGGLGMVNAGRIMGMLGTALLVLTVLIVAGAIALIIGAGVAST